jgi:hypothetical protein
MIFAANLAAIRHANLIAYLLCRSISERARCSILIIWTGFGRGRIVRDRTKGIDQSHLLDCAARHVEEARAGENNA